MDKLIILLLTVLFFFNCIGINGNDLELSGKYFCEEYEQGLNGLVPILRLIEINDNGEITIEISGLFDYYNDSNGIILIGDETKEILDKSIIKGYITTDIYRTPKILSINHRSVENSYRNYYYEFLYVKNYNIDLSLLFEYNIDYYNDGMTYQKILKLMFMNNKGNILAGTYYQYK